MVCLTNFIERYQSNVIMVLVILTNFSYLKNKKNVRRSRSGIKYRKFNEMQSVIYCNNKNIKKKKNENQKS